MISLLEFLSGELYPLSGFCAVGPPTAIWATEPKRSAADSEAVKVLNGPSAGGLNRSGYTRKVGPGDMIIIPAGAFHGWSQITDQVTYMSVRPDPDRVLPTGYVNPTLKK